MNDRVTHKRTVWITVGLLAGMGIAYFWPHEPALALMADRSDQFMMATSTVGYAAGTEAVWVLDFLTGRLQGAILDDKSGRFLNYYIRNNLAADFGIQDKGAQPKYCMVTSSTTFTGSAGNQMAAAAIYIGELTSGKVIAYGFPYRETSIKPAPPLPLRKLDLFQFRQSLTK